MGDGATDDSSAFTRAIASLQGGVLYVPAGRYVITRRLWVNSTSLVIKGAGQGKTVLYFPYSLSEVYRSTGEQRAVVSSPALTRIVQGLGSGPAAAG